VNGQSARPAPRGDGCFVFINIERTDFRLDAVVAGYEKYSVNVCFEELDDRIPTCDIFLIPSERNAKGGTVIGIFGNLPFLEAIEAVDLNRPVCRLSDYTEKKRKMSVIKQAGRILDMSYGHYGLLQADGKSYEKLYVSETDAVSSIILKETLKLPYTVNAPIARIVFGSVDAEGNYLLRVRDDSRDLQYLIRYVYKSEVYYQQVDLHDPAGCVLTQHPAESSTKKKSSARTKKKEDQE
jgi:hypothetical protein